MKLAKYIFGYIYYFLIFTQKFSLSAEETAASGGVDSGSANLAADSNLKRLDLDLDVTENLVNYTYNKEGNIATFTANDGYGFNVVKKAKTGGLKESIWNSNVSNKLSNVVKLVDYEHSGMFGVEVNFKDSPPYSYVFESVKPWSDVVSSGLTAINVNFLKDVDQTNYYTTFDGNMRTFIPKKGYIFKSLKDGEDSETLANSVWNTTTDTEYSRKIEMIGNTMVVYMGDGSKTKCFGSDEGQWTEKTYYDLDTIRPKLPADPVVTESSGDTIRRGEQRTIVEPAKPLTTTVQEESVKTTVSSDSPSGYHETTVEEREPSETRETAESVKSVESTDSTEQHRETTVEDNASTLAQSAAPSESASTTTTETTKAKDKSSESESKTDASEKSKDSDDNQKTVIASWALWALLAAGGGALLIGILVGICMKK